MIPSCDCLSSRKHILGHAGATLIGDSYVEPLFSGPFGGETGHQRSAREEKADYDQLNNPTPGHTVDEIHAEINGDYAGRKVGNILQKQRDGDITEDQARQLLKDQMCDY